MTILSRIADPRWVFPLVLCVAGSAAAADAAPQCASVSAQTCRIAASLGRGINLGNMLEAPREGDWGLRAEPEFIDLAASNFATVRVPVRWSNHAAPTADATLDEGFAKRVDQVVDALLQRKVNVILDFHGYSQIYGDGRPPTEFAVDPELVETRFLNIWRQVAQRYKDRSPKLLFELLNEPHGRLDGEPWNVLAEKGLAVVRESNPTRVVLIGPSYWNSVHDLPKLRMPKDDAVILAIHNYEPFEFTHQGASWIPMKFPVGAPCCNDAQRKRINDSLEQARRWSLANGIPVHLGEFGAYSAAPMESRAAYTRIVRDAAEARGFGWTYWELASSFGVYSPKDHAWNAPLKSALLD